MSKQTLHYLVSWEPVKERTWSGTGWSLYQALSTLYNVVEHDTTFRPTIIDKILAKFFNIQYPDRMGLTRIERYRKIWGICNLLRAKGTNILQLEENIFDSKYHHTYIYQDLTATYLYHLFEHDPELFKKTPFANMPHKYLRHRAQSQEKYYKTCSGILCMSQWLKKDLIERQGIDARKVHYVGAGTNINPVMIEDGNRNNRKILFLGRDFKGKGGDVTYEAFRLLKQRMPDAELYVAGMSDNPVSKPIDGYHYLGILDYPTVAKYLNKCDIFCLPSYFEGFGLVFVEALIFGLPCIARNILEMPYLIEDGETGFLIDEDNPEKLADMMEDLLQNRRIKENVLNKRDWYINEYSWDAVARRIHNIIG